MRFKIFLSIFVMFLCFTLVSCKSTQEQGEVIDLTQVRKSLEEANAKFCEALRQGDTAAVASLYTDDARLLPPNSEIIQGKQDVETFWGGAMQMGVKDAILTTVDVIGMGDMVFEIGKYVLTIQPEGQDAVEDSGKYIVLWKKVADGEWKLHVDIWNTNLPAL
jgi:uncharacterized protein (TIGR02246 family)